MRRVHALLLLLGALPPSAAAEGVVYLITGGGSGLQAPSVLMASSRLHEHVRSRYPGAEIKTVHNSHRDQIAREILERQRAGDNRPVTLIGHSWGAEAAVDIANAIEPRGGRIASMVTVDHRRGLVTRSAEVIPDNVARVENYYEQQFPLVLPGTPNMVRRDGSHRGIHNEKVGVLSAMPHVALLGKLASDGKLQGAVDRTMASGNATAFAQLQGAADRPQGAVFTGERARLGGPDGPPVPPAPSSPRFQRAAYRPDAPAVPRPPRSVASPIDLDNPKSGAERSALPFALQLGGIAAGVAIGLLVFGGPLAAVIGAVAGLAAGWAAGRLARG